MLRKTDKGETSGTGRKRQYAFLVYPESAPANWLEILDDAHCPALVSPLHDKDINPDGTQKKPHYHVFLLFDGVKTIEQAKAIKDSLHGVGWEKVGSTRGYARYLCHLDNPEKAQYDKNEIRSFCGLDYRSIVTLPTDIDAMLDDMTRFIDANMVYSYRAFASYCRDYSTDWSYVLKHAGSYYIKEYIKSLAWDEISPDAKALERKRLEAGYCPLDELGKAHEKAHEKKHEKAHETCPFCNSTQIIRKGKTSINTQRFKCKGCGKTFTKKR